MKQNGEEPQDNTIGQIRRGILMPAVLAVILVALLFSLPQPAIRVNQPFKIELLLSLFNGIFLISRYRKLKMRAMANGRDDRVTRMIAVSIGVFVLWSGISVLWGASFSLSLIHI